MTLRLAAEPVIPIATEFATIPVIRGVIRELDSGLFRTPAILIERMCWNARLRGVLDTYLDGFVATKIRWAPARNNALCRRAARDIVEDFPWMMPPAQRKAQAKWGLLLGFSLGQRVLLESPTSQRHLYRYRSYWPGWAQWDWTSDVYRVAVRDGDMIEVQSTSTLEAPADASSPWIVHEPYGEHSWRDGLIHAVWRPTYGHDMAYRDLNRSSEKHGIGTFGVKHPSDAMQEDVDVVKRGLRTMGSEGVIPLPQRPAMQGGGWDVVPLEFTGVGGQTISDALNTSAIALSILILGHNLTSEIKGGGSYAAAAGPAEYIRSDKKLTAGECERATVVPQLVAHWALANYGDPEVAPIPVYESDPPSANRDAAQTLQLLGLALRELKALMPALDLDAIAERYQLPLSTIGKTQAPAPASEESAS
jgi:hypothetical protein